MRWKDYAVVRDCLATAPLAVASLRRDTADYFCQKSAFLIPSLSGSNEYSVTPALR